VVDSYHVKRKSLVNPSRASREKSIVHCDNRVKAIIGLVLLLFTALFSSARSVERVETAGGTMTFIFNSDALAPLGIELDTSSPTTASINLTYGKRYQSTQTHIAQTSGLEVAAHGSRIDGIVGGFIELHDGPLLKIPQGIINWRLARIRPSTPPTLALSVTDRASRGWANLDHPHYGFSSDGRSLWMDDFDLRIGPDFAKVLGVPAAVNTVIGSVRLELPIIQRYAYDDPAARRTTTCKVEWPSASNLVDLNVILLDHDPELGGLADSVTVMRCGIPDGHGSYGTCTESSTDGLVVLAPDVAVVNAGTASIAWRPMFSPPRPPYGNDQHPYLFWNLYRNDPDGTFVQIGRSGVKHAYYADNFSCSCPALPASYPGCYETYAAGTNDMASSLGPRSEVLPATGQWGRCGSVFDSKCDGKLDQRYFAADDGYRHRLAVRESELLPGQHRGSRYVLEYGYLVRDQVDPEKAIAHRWIVPSKSPAPNGVRWSVTPISFAVGPAINAWVNPDHPQQGAMSRLLVSSAGRLRVAAVITKLPDGKYRYQYAIQNINYSPDDPIGEEPNLRATSSTGITEVALVLGRGTAQSDIELGNVAPSEWSAELRDDQAIWRSPAGESLTWGNMVSFAFVSRREPSSGAMLLRPSRNSIKELRLDLVVPVSQP
jgi:hypothetical protein